MHLPRLASPLSRAIAIGLFLTAAALPARAAATPESVEKLMQVMQVQTQLDAIYAQTLPAMQNMMRQQMAQQGGGEDAARLYDQVMPKINAVIREEFSWPKLKTGFAQVYSETFTQAEVDGLIAFYQTPIGKALVQKTPQLAQRSMMMMQQRVPQLMQRITTIAREETAKARPAASGAKR